MASPLQTAIDLHDSAVLSSGTKRAKLKRLFSSLSGSASSTENRTDGYDTPPTPDEHDVASPNKHNHSMKRMRFFFSRHFPGQAKKPVPSSSNNTNDTLSIGDYSCYNRYKTDGPQLERLFNEAVVEKRPPVTRDDIVRKMKPFEAMDPNAADNWLRKIQDFNITFSPVESGPGLITPVTLDEPESAKEMGMEAYGQVAPDEERAAALDAVSASSNNAKSGCYEYGNPSALPDLIFGLETAPTDSLKDTSFENPQSSLKLIEEKSSPFNALSSGRSLKNGSKTVISSANTALSRKSDRKDLNSSQEVVIPTFREDSGLEVHSIASNLQGGTLTEADLIKLASAKKRSFMDAQFYEEDSIYSEDPLIETIGGNAFQRLHDEPALGFNASPNNPPSYNIDANEKNDTVKFNKFSYLVIYDASKKCLYSESTDRLTLRIPNDDPGNSIIIDAESTPFNHDQRQKSILKRRTNEQADIESERAKKCDEINTSDFLEFVENHEYQRRHGDHILVRARERQLQHYYADDFSSEPIKIKKEKSSFSDLEDEYRKSSGLAPY